MNKEEFKNLKFEGKVYYLNAKLREDNEAVSNVLYKQLDINR